MYVKEYTSSGISVAGEVAKPRVYSRLGPHLQMNTLQAACCLTEKAASKATISHRGNQESYHSELPKDPEEMARNNVELLLSDTVGGLARNSLW